jgi:hypothetical protein
MDLEQATAPDQVWSTDGTYIPLLNGCLYLVAIVDLFSSCPINAIPLICADRPVSRMMSPTLILLNSTQRPAESAPVNDSEPRPC